MIIKNDNSCGQLKYEEESEDPGVRWGEPMMFVDSTTTSTEWDACDQETKAIWHKILKMGFLEIFFQSKSSATLFIPVPTFFRLWDALQWGGDILQYSSKQCLYCTVCSTFWK